MKAEFTYVMHPGKVTDSTILDSAIHVPVKNMAANSSFSNSQNEKGNKQETHWEWDRV